jgi:hypothetical protein
VAKVIAATKAATVIELGSLPWFKGGLATVQARTSMKHLKSAGEMYSANLELTVELLVGWNIILNVLDWLVACRQHRSAIYVQPERGDGVVIRA